jgi:hypothetical protein
MDNKATEAERAEQPGGPSRARCEAPGCESPAIYRGTCSPEHFQERALRRRAALHGIKIDGSSEPGNADLDAFRAGAYNVVDREAVVSSLCDEVEQLRAIVARVIDETPDLGECSKDGCERPAIEAKPGYVGPLYCSPVHAFVDRSNRVGGVR